MIRLHKLFHSYQITVIRTQRRVIIKTFEILQDLLIAECTPHMFGEDRDARREERCAPPQMRQDDPDGGIFAFAACYDKVGCCFEGFVWNL